MIKKKSKWTAVKQFEACRTGHVEGRARLVGTLHGVDAPFCDSSGACEGLRRFLEFFLSIQSALELPLEDLSGQSNAFKSSRISGLTSMMSS